MLKIALFLDHGVHARISERGGSEQDCNVVSGGVASLTQEASIRGEAGSAMAFGHGVPSWGVGNLAALGGRAYGQCGSRSAGNGRRAPPRKSRAKVGKFYNLRRICGEWQLGMVAALSMEEVAGERTFGRKEI